MTPDGWDRLSGPRLPGREDGLRYKPPAVSSDVRSPAESVAVYRTRDDKAAHLGELSTTALVAQGCRGAVVDGGVRDVGQILDREFPVFTRYRTPADAPPR